METGASSSSGLRERGIGRCVCVCVCVCVCRWRQLMETGKGPRRLPV